MLVVIPKYDSVTDLFSSLQISVPATWTVLNGNSASRAEIESHCRAQAVPAIFLLGHGWSDCLFTAPDLGKENRSEDGMTHGVIVDRGDLAADLGQRSQP